MKSLNVLIIITLLTISLSIITAWQPDVLIVKPTELDIGAGVETRTRTVKVMFYNTGAEGAEISRVTLTGSGADRFVIDRTPFTIAEGDSVPFTIQFILCFISAKLYNMYKAAIIFNTLKNIKSIFIIRTILPFQLDLITR